MDDRGVRRRAVSPETGAKAREKQAGYISKEPVRRERQQAVAGLRGMR